MGKHDSKHSKIQVDIIDNKNDAVEFIELRKKIRGPGNASNDDPDDYIQKKDLEVLAGYATKDVIVQAKYIWNNPLASYTVDERRFIIEAIKDVKIRYESNERYALNYLQRGDVASSSKISIRKISDNTSFAGDFGIGEVSGILVYQIKNPINGDIIWIRINWDVVLIKGNQITLSSLRSEFSLSCYDNTPTLKRLIYEDTQDVLNAVELQVINSIQDIYVRLKSSNVEVYQISYIQRGSATLPTVFSFFYGIGVSSFAATFPVGTVSGSQTYICIDINNGNEVVVNINWDLFAVGGTKVDVTRGRAKISKSRYFALNSVRTNLLRDEKVVLNASEQGALNGLIDISVKSKLDVLTNYCIRYIRRGATAGSITTGFSFYNGAEPQTNSYPNAFEVGDVSGIKDYVFIAGNGDEIAIRYNWDLSTIAPGEQRELTNGKAFLSKKAYSVIGGYSATVDLLLPEILPVAKGVYLGVYPESLTTLNSLTEYNSRVDILGGDYFVANSNYRKPWAYQFAGGSIPAQFTISVQRKTFTGTIIIASNIIIKPVSNVYNPAITVNELLIGDSNVAISNGVILRTYKESVIANGSFIPNLIGTLTETLGGTTVKHEGHPGSTVKDYCTAATLKRDNQNGSTTNIPNPFLFSGVFNFSSYIATNSLPTPKIVNIMSGANDLYALTTTEYIDYLKTMIQSIWAFDPTIKVNVCQPTMGAMLQNGGQTIKNNIVAFNIAMKAAFGADIYKSASNVPVKIIGMHAIDNRVDGYGLASASRYGDLYSPPTEYTHNNTAGYRAKADLLFSHNLWRLISDL